MSDTERKTTAQWDAEYTTSVGIFPDSLGIVKGATTKELTLTKREAFKVKFGPFSFSEALYHSTNYRNICKK